MFGEVCGKALLRIGIFLVKFRATFLHTCIILLGRSPQVYTKLHKFLGSFAVKRHSPKDGHFGGDYSSLFLESPLKKSPANLFISVILAIIAKSPELNGCTAWNLKQRIGDFQPFPFFKGLKSSSN